MLTQWKKDNEFRRVPTCSTCKHRVVTVDEDLICNLMVNIVEESGYNVFYEEDGGVRRDIVLHDDNVCKLYEAKSFVDAIAQWIE